MQKPADYEQVAHLVAEVPDERNNTPSRFRVAKFLAIILAAVALVAACLGPMGMRHALAVTEQSTKSITSQEEMLQHVPATLTKRDLSRAKQVVPGPAFQVAHSNQSNSMLNRHLRRLTGEQTVPCEDFSLEQLETLHHNLMAKKHPELYRIYASNRHPWKGEAWRDPRGLDAVELDAGALAHVGEQDARVGKSERLCYEIAMHFTHGLAAADRREWLAANRLPLLPQRSSEATNKHFIDRVPGRRLGSAAAGKSVFVANCNACHVGGKNVVSRSKTLQKRDLEKYSMYDKNKMVQQVSNGKGAMPRFKGRLNPQQIDDVATYVYEKAGQGW